MRRDEWEPVSHRHGNVASTRIGGVSFEKPNTKPRNPVSRSQFSRISSALRLQNQTINVWFCNSYAIGYPYICMANRPQDETVRAFVDALEASGKRVFNAHEARGRVALSVS